jgi:hypothetical protein
VGDAIGLGVQLARRRLRAMPVDKNVLRISSLIFILFSWMIYLVISYIA